MDPAERKKHEVAGYAVGDAGDFLGLNDAERQLVDLRIVLSRAVKKARADGKLTQSQAAGRLKTSQPRYARVEAGYPDVSLDQICRALFALGGTLDDLVEAVRTTPRMGASKVKPAAVVGVSEITCDQTRNKDDRPVQTADKGAEPALKREKLQRMKKGPVS